MLEKSRREGCRGKKAYEMWRGFKSVLKPPSTNSGVYSEFELGVYLVSGEVSAKSSVVVGILSILITDIVLASTTAEKSKGWA